MQKPLTEVIGPLGVSRTVHDLDEYRDLAVGAESETMQLGPGRLEASLFRIQLGSMVLNSASHNTIPMSTTAVGPSDHMTFVILLKAPAWGDFNGQPHTVGGLQVLGPSGSIVTHNAPGAEVAILQATPQAIRARAEQIGLESHLPERMESVPIPGTDRAARALRNCVKDALDVAMNPALRPRSFDEHTFGKLVTEEFSTLAAL